jgi:hypothetical protein
MQRVIPIALLAVVLMAACVPIAPGAATVTVYKSPT